jgi:short-subunit dehydrogenase
MELRGKTIWLIGASTGIGAALAVQLAHAGARLTLSARDIRGLESVAAQCAPIMPTLVPLDVTSLSACEAAWQTILSGGEMPDLVLYNAGAYEPMAIQQLDLAKAQHMLEVNITGALRILSLVMPAFLARNAGHIALVGSVAGYRGLPGAIGYGASKAALIHLAENLRADLANTAIGISIINPGFVKTRLTDKNDFHMPARITPEEAARAIMHGLMRGHFEIHFPKRFTRVLKLLRIVPYGLYFRLLRAFKL